MHQKQILGNTPKIGLRFLRLGINPKDLLLYNYPIANQFFKTINPPHTLHKRVREWYYRGHKFSLSFEQEQVDHLPKTQVQTNFSGCFFISLAFEWVYQNKFVLDAIFPTLSGKLKTTFKLLRHFFINIKSTSTKWATSNYLKQRKYAVSGMRRKKNGIRKYLKKMIIQEIFIHLTLVQVKRFLLFEEFPCYYFNL